MKFQNPKIILIGICLLFWSHAHAQFAAQQSMSAFQSFATNCAIAGEHNALQVQMQYRTMWTGIEGAPNTGQLGLCLPVLNKKLFGTLQIQNDQIGLYKTLKYMAGGTYKLQIKTKHYIHFGLQFGVRQMVYNANKIVVSDLQDPDLNLQQTKTNTFQMGSGIFYRAPLWYAGISVPEMLTPTYIGGGQWKASNDISKYNYHIQLGKKWQIESDWKLHTGIYMKKISALTHQTELYVLMENAWINTGIGYRHKDCIQLLLQWKINEQLKISYAYDHPSTQMRNATQGSHEWMLGYVFSYDNKTNSPRTL